MALSLLQMLFVWKSCQHMEPAIIAGFQVSLFWVICVTVLVAAVEKYDTEKNYGVVKTVLLYTDKLNCHICDEILEGLENIDDECDVYGIHLVKIQDPQLAKRYSIKTFPALVYFRNGNPLLYEGKLYLTIAEAS